MIKVIKKLVWLFTIPVGIGLLLLYHGTARAEAGQKVKVMSYNIQGGCTAPMNEGKYNLNKTIDVIKAQNPDIVLLQEVADGGSKGTCSITQKQSVEIPKLLDMKGYHYNRVFILIKKSYSFAQTKGAAYKTQDKSGLPRVYQRAVVKLDDGTEIVVYNTHTERFDKGVREAQITELHSLAQKEVLPAIAGGDFNDCSSHPTATFSGDFVTPLPNIPTFTPLAPSSQKTWKLLKDSSGCQSSNSSTLDEKIDYLYASKAHWKIGAGEVVLSAGPVSDHYPITASFTLTQALTMGIGKSCGTNSDCNYSLDCEDSSLEKSNDDFCVCSNAKHCADAYGIKMEGEVWECTDEDVPKSFTLHYCVSNKRGPFYPITIKDGEPVAAANDPTSGTVTGDVSKAYNNEIFSEEELRALLQKPNPKIKIPFVNFSDIDIQGQLSGDDLGNTYLNIPFLGEYIAGLYKYLIMIAGIFCVVRIIIGGFLFGLPDSSGNSKSSGKEMIKQAVVGLLITVSSYTILYSINPELVQFKNLQVLYARGQGFPFEDVTEDTEATGYAAAAPKGTISADAAKTIGGLVQPSTFPACSKEAAQDISKKLHSLNICVGPCHCAFTASRFLSFIGCGNPLHGSANRLAIQLEQMGWVSTKITKENANKLPVGMAWFPGHVGVSIGDQKIFQSGTDNFFTRVAKGGNCPTTYPAAVANPGICSYCAKLTPEDPSTGKYGANGVAGGKYGADSCIKNQGWGETSDVGNVVNFRLVISPPGTPLTPPPNPLGCCTIKNKNLMSEILCQEFAKSNQKAKLEPKIQGTIKVFMEGGKAVGSWDAGITTKAACEPPPKPKKKK